MFHGTIISLNCIIVRPIYEELSNFFLYGNYKFLKSYTSLMRSIVDCSSIIWYTCHPSVCRPYINIRARYT
jgi:hypothetical protein